MDALCAIFLSCVRLFAARLGISLEPRILPFHSGAVSQLKITLTQTLAIIRIQEEREVRGFPLADTFDMLCPQQVFTVHPTSQFWALIKTGRVWTRHGMEDWMGRERSQISVAKQGFGQECQGWVLNCSWQYLHISLQSSNDFVLGLAVFALQSILIQWIVDCSLSFVSKDLSCGLVVLHWWNTGLLLLWEGPRLSGLAQPALRRLGCLQMASRFKQQLAGGNFFRCDIIVLSTSSYPCLWVGQWLIGFRFSISISQCWQSLALSTKWYPVSEFFVFHQLLLCAVNPPNIIEIMIWVFHIFRYRWSWAEMALPNFRQTSSPGPMGGRKSYLKSSKILKDPLLLMSVCSMNKIEPNGQTTKNIKQSLIDMCEIRCRRPNRGWP